MKAHKDFVRALILPSTIAHELTHAAVALPWVEDWDVEINPLAGEFCVDLQWRDGVKRWQVALASFAPCIAGILALAVALLLWMASGGAMPSTGMDLAWLSILAMWWVLYVVPSPADVDTAIRGGK